MNDRRMVALTRFDKALEALEMACLTASTELERDGTIQRFEFTFELSWKCLATFLEYEGFALTSGPRSSIKEAARRDLLDDVEDFLDMLEAAIQTVAIYPRRAG